MTLNLLSSFKRATEHPEYKTPHYQPNLRKEDLQLWQYCVVDAVEGIMKEQGTSASLEEIYQWLLDNQARLRLPAVPHRRFGLNLDRRVAEAALFDSKQNFSMLRGLPQIRGIGKVKELEGNSRYILNPNLFPEAVPLLPKQEDTAS